MGGGRQHAGIAELGQDYVLQLLHLNCNTPRVDWNGKMPTLIASFSRLFLELRRARLDTHGKEHRSGSPLSALVPVLLPHHGLLQTALVLVHPGIFSGQQRPLPAPRQPPNLFRGAQGRGRSDQPGETGRSQQQLQDHRGMHGVAVGPAVTAPGGSLTDAFRFVPPCYCCSP